MNVNLVCPAGLGDTVIAARIAAALVRGGASVGIRNRGQTNWVERGLPVLDGIGGPLPNARELDLCDHPQRGGWDYTEPDPLHARVAQRAGLDPGQLPKSPWLRVPPPTDFEADPYIVISPLCSRVRGHLSSEQVNTVATLAMSAYGLRCVAVGHRQVSDLPRGVEDLTGQTTLGELCRIVAHARIVVAPDTGTLHLSGAYSVPVLGVCGVSIAAVSFAREYTPSVLIQTRPLAENAPCGVLRDLLDIMLRSKDQGSIDRAVTSWCAKVKQDALSVAG